MRKFTKVIVYTLVVLFMGAILESCVYAPKQAWTPTYRSHKQSKKKR